MCGRFYVPEDSEITMLRKVMENLESRNVTVKTGEVSPGDVAAVIGAEATALWDAMGIPPSPWQAALQCP